MVVFIISFLFFFSWLLFLLWGHGERVQELEELKLQFLFFSFFFLTSVSITEKAHLTTLGGLLVWASQGWLSSRLESKWKVHCKLVYFAVITRQISFWRSFLPWSRKYWFPGRLLLKDTGRKVPSVSSLALRAQRMLRLSREKHQIMLPQHLRGKNSCILELFQHLKGQICFSAISTMLHNAAPKPRESCKWLTNWLHWVFIFGLYPNRGQLL